MDEKFITLIIMYAMSIYLSGDRPICHNKLQQHSRPHSMPAEAVSKVEWIIKFKADKA